MLLPIRNPTPTEPATNEERTSVHPSESGELRSVEAPAKSGVPEPHSPDWVLLIDDDRIAVRSLARRVNRTGLAVRVAKTVHQAECWLRCMPSPAAIVTDFDLGEGVTGVDALKRIRARGCHAPAAIFTGAPELALDALASSQLDEVIPVLAKSEGCDRLLDWLDQLRLCWAESA